MGSDHVCLLGKTGSDRRTVKVTRLTQTGRDANQIASPSDQAGSLAPCRLMNRYRECGVPTHFTNRQAGNCSGQNPKDPDRNNDPEKAKSAGGSIASVQA